MTHARTLVLAGVLVSAALACSSDDDDGSSSSDDVTAADSDGGVSDAVGTGADRPDDATDGTTPSSTGPPASSGERDDPDVTVDGSGGEETAVEAIEAAMPDARDLGVGGPRWSMIAHTADQADIPTDEIDPFEGLLTCPDGSLLPNVDAPWVEHRYRAEAPVDGKLTVRVASIAQDEAAHQRFTQALQRCEQVSPEVFFEAAELEIDLDGETVDAVFVDVLAPATGVVPFPSQAAYLAVHIDDVTVVGSIFGAQDEVGFFEQAGDLLQVAVAGFA